MENCPAHLRVSEFNEDVDAGAKIGIKMKCNSVDVIAINFQP